ncbi:hypothetical protein PR048_018846 [Dryococelus australis]|uniref:Uncharacterized protein n=1 Tax=Dryococelus australis TaxID=614101 RepID=A0ABQ9H1W5_9NEOP|nr:hypothetical protein PR048_018846 [Dryococelus australis]
MEQRWNEEAGETGDLRENPPTSGIVRHDYHVLESGRFTQWGKCPWCEATSQFSGSAGCFVAASNMSPDARLPASLVAVLVVLLQRATCPCEQRVPGARLPASLVAVLVVLLQRATCPWCEATSQFSGSAGCFVAASNVSLRATCSWCEATSQFSGNAGCFVAASNVSLVRGYQPVSPQHIAQVISLHECLNTNSLGQLWTSSMPFLYPFIVQFSLIAAAVTFVMGQNVGRSRIEQARKKAHTKTNNNNSSSSKCAVADGDWNMDCGGATKGLFLGLLCMVAGIVVIIIFLVVKEDEEFPMDTVFWLTSGTLAAILSLSTVVAAVGLVQVRKLSFSGREPSALDTLLGTATSTGVQVYSVFGAVVGASGVAAGLHDSSRHAMLLAVSVLQLLQACGQSIFVAESVRRCGLARHHRPARQAVTFLLCSNCVLWAFDTFVTQSWMSQELQLRFFGVLAWGVVSRVGLPLLVFYRFHSCVLLLEAWKHSYRTPLLDPGN